MAEKEGLLKTIPGFHPAGALRATKFVPDKFVKPSPDALRREGSNPLRFSQINKPPLGDLLIWRRERDSNPRWAF